MRRSQLTEEERKYALVIGHLFLLTDTRPKPTCHILRAIADDIEGMAREMDMWEN